MEPFGASGTEVRHGKPLKDMVGTRRLELLTSTVSSGVDRFYNNLQVRGGCLSTRKSYKTSHFVERFVDRKLPGPPVVFQNAISSPQAYLVTSKRDTSYWHFATMTSCPVQHHPRRGKCEHVTREGISRLAVARQD